MIGATISHYRLLEKLGEGGMGVVYRAQDTSLLREVALKLLPEEYSSDEERRKRFLREARTAAALNHPGICTIHHVGEEAGRPFIAMELVPGQTLAAILAAGSLPLPDLLRTAVQIADALAEAHAHRIVHRDLKPQNVMLTPAGRAKILDFGLAKPVDTSGLVSFDSKRETSSFLSREGVVVGTVPYLSPEQAQGKPVDSRSDVFSFGTMLYEMATRTRPFRGETAASVVARILETEPPSVTVLRPELPVHLGRIVRQCLQKRPDDRYNDTKDLVADLEEVRISASSSATAQGRRRTVLGLAGLSVGIVAVVVGMLRIPGLRPRQSAQVAHRQLTFTGKAALPALSPDGSFIAYVDNSTNGQAKVMVRELAGGQAIEALQVQDCVDLRWSPTGTEILLAARVGNSYSVFSLPRLGGSPRQVATGGYLARISWSQEGSRFAETKQPREWIDLHDRSSGQIQRIVLGGSYRYIEGIDWSPGRPWIILTTRSERPLSALWAVSLRSDEQFQLLQDVEAELGPARWAPHGDAIYYMRVSAGTAGLWKVKVAPETAQPIGAPKLLVAGLQAGTFFTISRDGKRLLYTRAIGYSNLWLVRPEAGENGKVTTVQLTSGTQTDQWPSVSPNGQEIAFSRRGPDTASIFVMPTEGGPARQLTLRNSFDLDSAWSPDGKEIAFGSNEGGNPHVWRVDARGGVARVFSKSVLSWEPGGPTGGSIVWSPGRQILYQVQGNTNYHLLDSSSEKETLLLQSENGWVFRARYSPDGLRVALAWMRTTADKGVWVIDLSASGSQPRRISQNSYDEPLGWSSDGNWVYILSRSYVTTGSDRVVMAPSKGGTERPYMRLPFRINDAALTPDGRLVATVTQRHEDIWLMENFDPDVP